MFRHGSYPGSEAKISAERCIEPDYESIYARLKKQLEVVRNFRSSLFAYLEFYEIGNFFNESIGSNPMVELLGHTELQRGSISAEMLRLEEKINENVSS